MISQSAYDKTSIQNSQRSRRRRKIKRIRANVPPNDQFNFFFRADEWFATYNTTGFNGTTNYSKQDADEVIDGINKRYSKYPCAIMIVIGLIVMVVAFLIMKELAGIGVLIMICGCLGFFNPDCCLEQRIRKVQLYLEDMNRDSLNTNVQWGLHPKLDYLHLCIDSSRWNPDGGLRQQTGANQNPFPQQNQNMQMSQQHMQPQQPMNTQQTMQQPVNQYQNQQSMGYQQGNNQYQRQQSGGVYQQVNQYQQQQPNQPQQPMMMQQQPMMQQKPMMQNPQMVRQQSNQLQQPMMQQNSPQQNMNQNYYQQNSLPPQQQLIPPQQPMMIPQQPMTQNQQQQPPQGNPGMGMQQRGI